jgi:hypothetical protein
MLAETKKGLNGSKPDIAGLRGDERQLKLPRGDN